MGHRRLAVERVGLDAVRGFFESHVDPAVAAAGTVVHRHGPRFATPQATGGCATGMRQHLGMVEWSVACGSVHRVGQVLFNRRINGRSVKHRLAY